MGFDDDDRHDEYGDRVDPADGRQLSCMAALATCLRDRPRRRAQPLSQAAYSAQSAPAARSAFPLLQSELSRQQRAQFSQDLYHHCRGKGAYSLCCSCPPI
jgi:hypothetical protein